MSGLFNSMKKELSSAATTISKEVNYVAKKAEDCWDENQTMMYHFRHGNVIQLVSRSSGKTLQVVAAPTGQLVVDGCGPEGPQAFNANWTVSHEGGNRIRLQSNGNYLAIMNGMTCILSYPPPTAPGKETRLQVGQLGQFVVLSSVTGARPQLAHVGVLPTGQLKSAIATGKEMDGQWGVRLIYEAPKPKPVPQPAPKATIIVQQGQPIQQPYAQATTTYVGPGTTIITQQRGAGGTTIIQQQQRK